MQNSTYDIKSLLNISVNPQSLKLLISFKHINKNINITANMSNFIVFLV